MPQRLPAPGPSYLRELDLRVDRDDRAILYRAGIGEPREMDDWWVALLWVAGADGRLADFRDLAPAAGPPPAPPLVVLGPRFSGGLSGMIAEEAGRQQVRLRLGVPPADEARPWDAPLVVLAAMRFEPLRVATMRPNEVARTVLTAFARAVEAVARP